MNFILVAIGPLGTTEMIIIGVLVLVLFGAKKLPTFLRSLGKNMGEFKKAREEFEAELSAVARRTTDAPMKPIPRRRIFWSQRCSLLWLVSRMVVLPCV